MEGCELAGRGQPGPRYLGSRAALLCTRLVPNQNQQLPLPYIPYRSGGPGLALGAGAGWRKGPSLSACSPWLGAGSSLGGQEGWLELTLGWHSPWGALPHRPHVCETQLSPKTPGCCTGAGTRQGVWGTKAQPQVPAPPLYVPKCLCSNKSSSEGLINGPGLRLGSQSTVGIRRRAA